MSVSVFGYVPAPRYYVYSTGTDFKAKAYNSRAEAQDAMYRYCIAHGLKIECTEDDRHFKKYSNHKGVRFYINRM